MVYRFHFLIRFFFNFHFSISTLIFYYFYFHDVVRLKTGSGFPRTTIVSVWRAFTSFQKLISVAVSGGEIRLSNPSEREYSSESNPSLNRSVVLSISEALFVPHFASLRFDFALPFWSPSSSSLTNLRFPSANPAPIGLRTGIYWIPLTG